MGVPPNVTRRVHEGKWCDPAPGGEAVGFLDCEGREVGIDCQSSCSPEQGIVEGKHCRTEQCLVESIERMFLPNASVSAVGPAVAPGGRGVRASASAASAAGTHAPGRGDVATTTPAAARCSMTAAGTAWRLLLAALSTAAAYLPSAPASWVPASFCAAAAGGGRAGGAGVSANIHRSGAAACVRQVLQLSPVG